MERFQVILSPAFQRDLHKLPKESARRILHDMNILKENPFPQMDKIKKIKILKDGYRLRIGDYRVIYRKEASKIIALRAVDRKEFEKILKGLI